MVQLLQGGGGAGSTALYLLVMDVILWWREGVEGELGWQLGGVSGRGRMGGVCGRGGGRLVPLVPGRGGGGRHTQPVKAVYNIQ